MFLAGNMRIGVGRFEIDIRRTAAWTRVKHDPITAVPPVPCHVTSIPEEIPSAADRILV